MKKIYITICILSFAFLFATASQADAGALAVADIVERCVQSLLLLAYGLSGLYRWERRARELRRRAARRADLRAAYYAPVVYDTDQPRHSAA